MSMCACVLVSFSNYLARAEHSTACVGLGSQSELILRWQGATKLALCMQTSVSCLAERKHTGCGEENI